jgi:hypothetical protein
MTTVDATAGRAPVERADQLATRREIWRFFVTCPSARVLSVAAAGLLAARLVVGGFGRGDIIALAVTLAITGTVEWIIHRYLLHAPLDSWAVPLMWLTGSSVLGGFLTAWILAAVGLVHYEFVHLMQHTRYRPRSRYYAGLTRRHRLHHFRNEHYWLGITSSIGDRLLRTDPAKGDVPPSDTARSLSG